MEKLGQESQNEQRAYLSDIRKRFTIIIRDAVKGIPFDHPRGTDTSMNFPGRPLRDIVEDKLADFSKEMRDRGCSLKVVADGVEIKDHEGPSAAKQISRSDYVAEVQDMLDKRRFGSFGPRLIGHLFQHQTTHWPRIVQSAAENIANNARIFIDKVLNYVAGKDVAEEVQRKTMGLEVDSLELGTESMIPLLLQVCQMYRPFTKNPDVIEEMHRARAQHRESLVRERLTAFLGEEQISQCNFKGSFQVDKLIECVIYDAKSTEQNMDKFEAIYAIDVANAHYKV